MNDDFYEKVGTEQKSAKARKNESNRVEVSADLDKSQGDFTFRRWSHVDGTYWSASPMRDTLEPGFYSFAERPSIGACVDRAAIAIDNLIELPDPASEEVIAEFAKFWTLESRFSDRGFLHKRGILLWGPPGSGKTSSLMLMSAKLIKAGGIVCKIDHPLLAGRCLSMIRKIEPSRPIVALMEDLDALIERYGESEYLALLDGESQVNRIVYIATTNYPERLDKRFVDRPSRFDTVRMIGMPSAAARRMYLTIKEPSLTEQELRTWVFKTEGFSVAHLRELIILVQCFGQSLDAAVARLERMRERQPKSSDSQEKPSMGIVFAKRAMASADEMDAAGN